ncbi:MAG TPA: N-formylglutamate amidohydrolase [Alphaproteobacteria bacterium]|nr:N-formylglutamate amidohydrolase [Alphaproteobacteria bacterium]
MNTKHNGINPPFEVFQPGRQQIPFVFACPHSGRVYTRAFLESARLDPISIRRSEDSFVDELFAAGSDLGAIVLKANFPRAYVDPNREPYELDPGMFDGPLPSFINARSPRVAAGLGTIAKVVRDGAEIYSQKLPFAEAQHRIETYYKPYHARLRSLLEETQARFGAAVVIDCHSMPSVGGPLDQDIGASRPDIVLGDRFGASCARRLTDIVERAFSMQGYVVTRNNPYAGGYTTEHYGRPAMGLHSLQIEINRALYMDEERIERGPNMPRLSQAIRNFIRALGEIDWRFLRPLSATGQAAQ